ncbi:MAG TPA: ABC transporter ATP-binding protein [Iamia sp.]|nr:ABC transporter ATP-binding protein [Iamia sp.]
MHTAVDRVDLRVAPGEAVGILGPNGAGKTTLLRLIAGVTAPTEGRVTTRGRVVPLISVGVGFHAELSGRENVRVNGQLLGLTVAEIDAAYDSIVAFAQLAGHMDQPVKLYSTGMQMRLAFAVAMHARPDVLLLDEILAVGDTAFQLRCLDRMTELQRAGTTIVFVSHSVHAVRLLCPRALVVDGGAVRFDGPSDAAVGHYHRLLSELGGIRDTDVSRIPPSSVRVVGSRLLDGEGREPDELVLGRRYVVRHRLAVDADVAGPVAEVVATSEAGVEAHRARVPLGADLVAGTEVELDVALDAALAGGTYRLTLAVLDADGRKVGDDGDGVAAYRPPALGSYGLGELDAEIRLDDVVLSDHEAVEIGAAR